MASIDVANRSTASIPTPASGLTTIFTDSATKALKSKDDTGAVTDYTAPGSAITALTGEVTATGPGSAAATISNAAVISKVLTGFVASSGTPVATDTILQAIEKLAGKSMSGFFGTGVDGDATITSDTTLVRDMYYNNLTINAGVTLFPGGFRIHVLNTFTNNGTLDRQGNPSTGNAGGLGLAAGSIGSAAAGGAGGGTVAGTAGTASSACIGSAAGSGGSGSGGAGGAAGGATVPTAAVGGVESMNLATRALIARDLAGTILNGGSGGGGGGGSGTAASGGGGGSGGGVIVVAARTFLGTGIVTAKGGNGASALLNNGGGGGGGGGGAIITITENDTTATGLTFNITGGTAGGGLGAGVSGANGSTGRIFRVRS